MSEYAIKPALASLPTELIMMIFPYSINLDVPPDERVDEEHPEHLAHFRALSQTCRRLREYALPLVYARIKVKTIEHLRELHALLMMTPSLASLVKSFRFIWNMDGDCDPQKLDFIGEEAGSALDLAFRDRLQMWDTVVKTGKGRLESDGRLRIGDELYSRPGKRRDDGPNDERLGGRGPDGNGEDKLIKDPYDFTHCVTEVISMLTSLETFGWETPVTPMPKGVFDALLQLPALTDLRLTLSSHRGNFSDLPLWQLAGNLRLLDVQLHDHEHANSGLDQLYGHGDREITIDVIEKHPLALPAYQSLLGNDARQAREAVHFSIAQRTIVTAAQGGHLKYLYPGAVGSKWHEYYAKIRALLPCWLAIEHWGDLDQATDGYWEEAAVKFRRTFAHVSLHRDWLTPGAKEEWVTSSIPQDSRLSPQDLKELLSYCRAAERAWLDGQTEDFCEISHEFVECSLPWLVEDAQLAQQVLDVWSAIVERGEALKVECHCRKCEAWLFG